MKAFVRYLAAASVVAGLAACAEVPTDPEDRAEFEATRDPLEPMNRQIFDFNMALDEAILQPVARAYRNNVPEAAQRSVHNALGNLKSPLIFANDVLQGEPDRAAQTLIRFMINSGAGLGGLFDVVADTNGPRHHDEDFGQTLAVWGVGDGPYLMLPFYGPSNPRDTVGSAVEWFADPTDIAFRAQSVGYVSYGRTGAGIVDDRALLLDPIDDLKRNSLDFYAAVRSVYRQKRANDIANKDLSAAEAYRRGTGK
jgi:phospholipid-binding lipoprotein MlaA